MAKRKVWVAIPGHPGYEITDDGDVRNAETRRPLKPYKTDRGTVRVTLFDGSGNNVKLAIQSLLDLTFGSDYEPMGKTISFKLPKSATEIVMTMPKRSEWLREVVMDALQKIQAKPTSFKRGM